MSNWQLPTLQTQYTKRHQREAQQCLRQQTRAISLRGRQLKNAAPKFGNLWATEAMLFASQWQVGCTCGFQEQFMFSKIVIMDTMNKRIVLKNCSNVLQFLSKSCTSTSSFEFKYSTCSLLVMISFI